MKNSQAQLGFTPSAQGFLRQFLQLANIHQPCPHRLISLNRKNGPSGNQKPPCTLFGIHLVQGIYNYCQSPSLRCSSICAHITRECKGSREATIMRKIDTNYRVIQDRLFKSDFERFNQNLLEFLDNIR